MDVDPNGNEASNVAQASGDDDLALLRGFVERGDRSALGALFSRHADAAYRFALRLSRSPSDAEDILQSAFLEVFRHASSFRGRASVRTWILGFVLHVSRNKAREEARRRARQERAAASDAAPVPATLDPEVSARVRRAVDDLPDHYRAPVWLHYGEGLSTDEVANVLDLSPDTVRKQLSRGIDRLRNDLLPYGAAMSVGTMLAALAVETAPPSVAAAVLQGAPALAASGAKIGMASKLAASVAAAVAIASSATFLWWGGRVDDARPREFAEIERRVREWQPTPDERRFDEIGWVGTIAESLRLSRESGRPLVLLTQSGHIELGRSDGGSQFLRSRALADPAVISLLNSCFVPVYVSNTDVERLGGASALEKKQRDRLWRDARDAGLPWGMDCLYLADPASGRTRDTLELSRASTQTTRKWLESHRTTPPGRPLVAPSPQSAPPAAPADALALHVTARYLDAKGNVERERADFHEVPAEDWLTLSPEEWLQFLPPEKEARRIDATLAERILTHLHPADMSIDADPNGRNRIQVADLVVRRVSRSYVRIEGRLEMRRSFTQVAHQDEWLVVAPLKGFIELERDGRRIRSLRLISEGATYGSQSFGVAVRSQP
jgi:RNA polymerase sigma-70 factor (ECF subfamily)